MSVGSDRNRLVLGVALAPLLPGAVLAAVTGRMEFLWVSLIWIWIPAAVIMLTAYRLLKRYFYLNLFTLAAAGALTGPLLAFVELYAFTQEPFSSFHHFNLSFIAAASGVLSAAAFWLIALFDWNRLLGWIRT